jgi:hypothetical protein
VNLDECIRRLCRTTSLVVAPDAFSERQLVVLHLIKVARELRKLNNYFASHAIQAGLRPTLFPGDLLTQLVEKDSLFKVLRSLEVLYADAKSNAAYRLGLKHTIGPAVADLYAFFRLTHFSTLTIRVTFH